MITISNGVEIQKSTECENDWALTNIETGKVVEIWIHHGVHVYVPTKRNRLPLGRHFNTLNEAVESYKDKQIKKMIRALISELV